jgi:hypothetical protein
MKDFFKKISQMLTSLFNSIAEARAASALARVGEYEKAKNVYK